MVRSKNFKRIFAVILLGLCACQSQPEEQIETPSHEDYLRLNFGPCFGTCPVYEIQLFRSGKLVYRGDKYVKIKGTVTRNMGEKLFADVEKLIFNVEATTLTDPKVCPRLATDFPAVRGELKVGEELRKISHYYGCRGYAWRKQQVELIKSLKRHLKTDEYTAERLPFQNHEQSVLQAKFRGTRVKYYMQASEIKKIKLEGRN